MCGEDFVLDRAKKKVPTLNGIGTCMENSMWVRQREDVPTPFFYCFLYRVMASMSEVMEMTTLAMDADALQMVKKGLFFTCAVRLGST